MLIFNSITPISGVDPLLLILTDSSRHLAQGEVHIINITLDICTSTKI